MLQVAGRSLTPWLTALVLSGCAEYASTTRMVDGRVVAGRPIPAEAYAAYLTGSVLEARGKPELAARSYRAALDADPEAVEVRTALARVTCAFAPDRADDEFAAALELDGDFEPLHREWARCALARGQKAQALAHARDALRSAPSEWAATEVLVDVLESSGQGAEAARYLWGFVALAPDDPRPLERLDALYEGAGPAVDPLRAALREGDDRRAVTLALERRMSDVELARTALEEARPDFALTRSQLVLFADPANSDARIVALVAAFLLEDGRAYRAALRDLWRDHALPSPEQAEALARLLRARVDGEAAALFLSAHREAVERGRPPPPSAPLPHELWLERREGDSEEPPSDAPEGP